MYSLVVKVEAIHWVEYVSNQVVPCQSNSDDYWATVMVHVWFDAFPIVEASRDIGFLLLEGYQVGSPHISIHKSIVKIRNNLIISDLIKTRLLSDTTF